MAMTSMTMSFDAKTETARAEAERMRPQIEQGQPYRCSEGWTYVKSTSAENAETPDPDGLGRKGHTFQHTDGSTLTVWPRSLEPAEDGRRREYRVADNTRLLLPAFVSIASSGTEYVRFD